MNKNNNSFSKIGAIIVAISSAVGLGNIWKFPSMVGDNGGSAFLFIYLLSSVLVSLPVLLAEFYIGYKTKQSPVQAIKIISNNKKSWQIISMISAFACLLIVAFYSDIIGWLLKYFLSSLFGQIQVNNLQEASELFDKTISSPLSNVIFQIIVIIGLSTIIFFGAEKGIEKTVRFSLPALFIILICIFCYSMTLPGRNQALIFLFKFDFSKLTSNVIINALGLAFFKMSAGMMVMSNYFSSFPNNSKPSLSLLKILFADLGISLLCGLAIFPMIFTYTNEVPMGPSLLFISIVVLCKKLSIGGFLLIIFMFSAVLSGLGALMSILACFFKYVEETYNIKRKKSILYSVSILLIFSLLASLSTTPVLDNFTIFNKNLFDLFDYISSNICLPLGGILIIAFILIEVKKVIFIKFMLDLDNNRKIINILTFLMSYITPFIILFVWLNILR